MLYTGETDVAFIRTDLLETMVADPSETVTLEQVKVLNLQTHALPSGIIFPFLASTPLYPEWPFGVNTHTVETPVSTAVIEALLALNSTSPAAKAGGYAGWQPALSYFDVRALQEELGVLRQTESGNYGCIRAATIREGLTCPFGYRMQGEEAFNTACQEAGLPCPVGMACLCRPCQPICRSHEAIDNDGQTCRCLPGYSKLNGSCHKTGSLITTVVAPCLLALALAGGGACALASQATSRPTLKVEEEQRSMVTHSSLGPPVPHPAEGSQVR